MNNTFDDQFVDCDNYYESVVINSENWFLCKFKDCPKSELNKQSIISHFNKKHLKNKQIIRNHNKSDEKVVHEIERRKKGKHCLKNFKSINNNRLNNNVFKCGFIGCGKTFFNRNTFFNHKNQHSIEIIVIDDESDDEIEIIENNETKRDIKCDTNNVINKNNKTLNKSLKKFSRDFAYDHNYRGIQSLQNLDQYFKRRVVNGCKEIMCKFDNKYCNYIARGDRCGQQMARHINLRHFKNRKFFCHKCPKIYESPTSLRTHLKDHLCGFGILNGKTLNTVCGNKSINKYRKRTINNSQKSYQCLWSGCGMTTNHHSVIKRHIHNQHLCPYRKYSLDYMNRENNINSYESKASSQEIQRKTVKIVKNINQNNRELELNKIKIELKINESNDKKAKINGKFDLNKSIKEVNTLRNMKNHFERKVIDNENYFQCKYCSFKVKVLKYISNHLEAKHFISLKQIDTITISE